MNDNRRFPWWKVRRVVLPLIAAGLALWLMFSSSGAKEQTGHGNTVWGSKGQTAFVVTVFEDGPLERFTLTLLERR